MTQLGPKFPSQTAWELLDKLQSIWAKNKKNLLCWNQRLLIWNGVQISVIQFLRRKRKQVEMIHNLKA